MVLRNASMQMIRKVGRRNMSSEMSAKETLAMQKLYPGTRTSWFGVGEQTSESAWEKTKKKWFIVEAFPLFAAIGGGCSICFLHCMRHLFFSPDVSANEYSFYVSVF